MELYLPCAGGPPASASLRRFDFFWTVCLFSPPVVRLNEARGTRRNVSSWRRGIHTMATGTVKWFNDAKGFGFLVQDGGGEDVFCHHTAIQSEGFRTLAEGQKVEFEVKKGPKGLQAANVRPL